MGIHQWLTCHLSHKHPNSTTKKTAGDFTSTVDLTERIPDVNGWRAGWQLTIFSPDEKNGLFQPIPIGSMYGIYANIWGILMVNVAIYSIHGSYGIGK